MSRLCCKARALGDFRDRQAGVAQKFLAFFDPVFKEILENRGAGHPFEKTFTFFRAEADCVRDLAQGDFLRVMHLQVVKISFRRLLAAEVSPRLLEVDSS